jgi:hypothetical protein
LVELVFVLVGLLIQAVGVGVTVKGLRFGWREIASPADRFLEPIYRLQAKVNVAFRRILPWRSNVHVKAGTAFGETVWMTDHVRVAKSMVPLPQDLDIPGSINELDKRLRDIYAALSDVENRLLAENDKRKKEHARLERELRVGFQNSTVRR